MLSKEERFNTSFILSFQFNFGMTRFIRVDKVIWNLRKINEHIITCTSLFFQQRTNKIKIKICLLSFVTMYFTVGSSSEKSFKTTINVTQVTGNTPLFTDFIFKFGILNYEYRDKLTDDARVWIEIDCQKHYNNKWKKMLYNLHT